MLTKPHFVRRVYRYTGSLHPGPMDISMWVMVNPDCIFLKLNGTHHLKCYGWMFDRNQKIVRETFS